MKLLTSGLLAVSLLGTSLCAGSPTHEMSKLIDGLKDVKYEGVLAYRYIDREVKNVDQKSINEVRIRLGLHAPITDNISGTVALEGGHVEFYNKTDNGVIKPELDVRNLYVTYMKDNLKVRLGQQPIDAPFTENIAHGTVGLGVQAEYKMDKVSLLAGYFSGFDDVAAIVPAFADLFWHGFRYNYNLPASMESSDFMFVAAKSTLGSANVQAWAVRAPGTFDYMMMGFVDGKLGAFNYAGEVVNTKLDNGDTGTHYAVKLGAEFGPVHGHVQHSKNDDEVGLYTIAGEDSEMIKTGVRLGTMIENVPGVDVYAGSLGMYVGEKTDVKLYYGQADVDGTYAGTVVDDTFTEYGATVEYLISDGFFVELAYSDISADNDTLDQKICSLYDRLPFLEIKDK